MARAWRQLSAGDAWFAYCPRGDCRPLRTPARRALCRTRIRLQHRAQTRLKPLSLGARLTTVAIETRRLYSDLVHRSEFDLLTDINNRFALDKHLDATIEEARQKAGAFGLIYVGFE